MPPELRHSIETLALALFHEKRAEARFMVLSAYLDESGTHDASLSVVMAGFVGTVRRWSNCQKRLRRLFYQYSIEKFHAKDLRLRSGEFVNWSDERIISFTAKFDRIIKSANLDLGLSVSLLKSDFREHYKPNIARRSVVRTEYGVCFYVFLGRLLNYLLHNPEKAPVYFVLEGGHRHSGNAEAIFHAYKASRSKEQRDLLGSSTFETKECCIELAPADAYATSVWQYDRIGFGSTPRHTGNPALESPKMMQIMGVEINRGILSNILKNPLPFLRY